MLKNLITVQGPWRQRMFIYLMTFFLALLFSWALEFVINDIRKYEDLSWTDFEKEHLSKPLLEQQKTLTETIQKRADSIQQLNQQRLELKQSTQSAQISIKQMDEQQKLLLQHGKMLSKGESDFKDNNMAIFTRNQEQDQKIAETLMGLLAEQQKLSAQLKNINTQLDKQREPLNKTFYKDLKHRAVLSATAQIIFLLVVLLLAVYLLAKYQKTGYRLPLLALFLATLYEMFFVVHYYFPTRYFKYLLIAALIVVIAKILVNLIKNASSQKPEVLLKRYREAYAYFLCPNCEFPIRRGPMKYLYWTRRSLPKLALGKREALPLPSEEETYTCPVCATALFSNCPHCKEVCYGLLPVCQHCGKAI